MAVSQGEDCRAKVGFANERGRVPGCCNTRDWNSLDHDKRRLLLRGKVEDIESR